MRNRVRELRIVRASALVPHPKNWRIHGEVQQAAVSDALRELGFADAIICYESTGELISPAGQLVTLDGHLRRECAGDAEVPVLILDLDDKEAEYFLATHDPLAALATTDTDGINKLAEEVATGSLQIRDLLDTLCKGISAEDEKKIETGEKEIPEMELQPFEHHDYIMLLFDNDQEFSNACERFGIKQVRVTYGENCQKVGLGRVVRGADVLKKLVAQ